MERLQGPVNSVVCYFPSFTSILSCSFSFSSNPISRIKQSTAFTPQYSCIKCIMLFSGNTCICPGSPLLTFYFRSIFIAHFSSLRHNPNSIPGSIYSLLLLKFLGEHLEVNCLEQAFVDTESLKLEEEEQFLISSLEDKMPFLHMLRCVESPQFWPFKEPSFQTLLRVQHLNKPWEGITYIPRLETQIQATELESCVTHDLVEMQSPLKSEGNGLQHPHSASCVEKVGYECNQEQPELAENCSRVANKDSPAAASAAWTNPQSWHKATYCSKPQVATGERKKRKRTRPTKNKEDLENQRMTHIAVERNRRRQMNDHLSVLRSLMPHSYIQRGDHASIIGGAIDFVKELEQLLQSLEAQKTRRKNEEVGSSGLFKPSANGYRILTSTTEEANCEDEVEAENKSEAAHIEVSVIQTYVNLKIQCQRRPGQLVKAIVALEDIRLTVLHLNITSSESSVFYSFNLKIEEDCKLGSANEIVEAARNIFCFINGN